MYIVKTEQKTERKTIPVSTGLNVTLNLWGSSVEGTLHAIEGTNQFVLIESEKYEVRPVPSDIGVSNDCTMFSLLDEPIQYIDGKLMLIEEHTEPETVKKKISVGDSIAITDRLPGAPVIGIVEAVNDNHLVVSYDNVWYLFRYDSSMPLRLNSVCRVMRTCDQMYSRLKLAEIEIGVKTSTSN